MQRSKTRLIAYFLLMLTVMVCIFCFSAQNADTSSKLSNGFISTYIGKVLKSILPRFYSDDFSLDIRKYAHMFEYLCLGISSLLFMKELLPGKIILPCFYAEIISFLYSCSDEFHQTFVPGRSGRLSDVGVDAIGFTTGIIILAAFLWLKLKICKGRE